MTQDELETVHAAIGLAVCDLYAACCEVLPKPIVIAGLTGGLAACATKAGVPREKVLAAINSAFDAIEDT